MTYTKRSAVVLAVLGLLVPGFSQAGQSSDVTAKRKLIISGQVGLPGVVMKGLPGNPVSGYRG